MKVLITCPCLDKASGIENYTNRIIDILLKRPEVDIFVFPIFKYDKYKIIDIFLNKKIKILENNYPMKYFGKNHKKSSNLFKNYCQFYNFDLIIDNTSLLPVPKNILINNNYFLVQHFDIKWFLYKINTFSGLFKRLWFFFSFSPIKFKYAKNIICYTELDKKIIKKHGKIKNQKFYVIPLSSFDKKTIIRRKTELEQFVQNKINDLIYIGRIAKKSKRFHWAIPLVRMTKKNNFNIKIFGWGPYTRKIEKITKTKILPIQLNDIHKKIKEYSDSMFSFLFSPYEGFSYSLVESISLGTPVIIRDHFNNSKYFETALKIKTFRKNKFAKEIEILINFYKKNKEKYFQLCLQTIDFALKNFTTEDFEKKWNQILDSKINKFSYK